MTKRRRRNKGGDKQSKGDREPGAPGTLRGYATGELWEDRYKRVRPEAYAPVPFAEFGATTEQDVAALTQAYLDDSRMTAMFDVVGTHQILSDAQQREVDAFSIHNSTIDWSDYDPELVPVAVALARRVNARQIPGTSSAEADEFIRDRFFARPDSHSARIPAVEFGHYPPAAELLDAARFLCSQERYRTFIFDRWENWSEQHSQEFLDEFVVYMYGVRDAYIQTHGLRVRRDFWGDVSGLMEMLRTGELSSLDEPRALNLIRDPSNSFFSREAVKNTPRKTDS
ncbi:MULTISPECIES: hypothetical protein [unclassified Bradyrhizobium]|uniref:hypothetical protein n=1 Tax=unclassified Bradyrhizobium TaxID=2631580 RepID=UPI0028EDF9A8|nr:MULTISPECIES: hypothetical protein [unclassified Bradyrhizobium]